MDPVDPGEAPQRGVHRPEQAYDDAVRLFLAVGRLQRRLRVASGPSLGHGAVSALSTLTRRGPLRMGDLAEREGVAAPSMTRIVGLLEADGYVVREADPDDRRALVVRVSEQGEALVRAARAGRAAWLAERIEALTEDELALLRGALPVLEQLAAAAAEPERG